MVSFRTFSQIYFKSHSKRLTDPQNTTTPKKQPEETDSYLYSAFRWLLGNAFYFFSLQKKDPPEDSNWFPLVVRSILDVLGGISKIALVPFVERSVFYLTTTGRNAADAALLARLSNPGLVPYPLVFLLAHFARYLHTCCETFAFAASVAALAMPTFDFLKAAIRLATKGHYELMSFNKHVILSKSLRELWGKRYNQLLNYWFKEVTFYPLLDLGASTLVAANACFATSAILHVYVAYFTFGGGLSTILRTSSFFLLHGFLCTIERPMFKKLKQIFGEMSDNTILRSVWTLGVMFLTLPIYVGFFTRNFSDWGRVNASEVSDWANNLCTWFIPASEPYSRLAIYGS
jgi:hypothetical protein